MKFFSKQGGLIFVETVKILSVIKILNFDLSFYTNNNTDQIHEPFMKQELFYDSLYHVNSLKIYI